MPLNKDSFILLWLQCKMLVMHNYDVDLSHNIDYASFPQIISVYM